MQGSKKLMSLVFIKLWFDYLWLDSVADVQKGGEPGSQEINWSAESLAEDVDTHSGNLDLLTRS